jgi:hypothetical protein
MKVLENRALRRIFGPKMDEVTGDWRRFHNQELYHWLSTKYYSGDQMDFEMGRACCTYAGRRGVYRVLVGKTEGKRPLGRPRRR